MLGAGLATVEDFLDGLVLLGRSAEGHVARALLLGLFAAAGYLTGRLAKAGYVVVHRGRTTSGQQIIGKTLVAAFSILGFSIGLSQVYGADIGAVAASLGVASLALGFGLQNTVANLAAGVSLSADKPFEVGDRIQVGTTWGDVMSIGLRSTRIRVTGGQIVSIPNALLDTREVWNSTYEGNQWLRLQVPFTISYDSSLALAESLCAKVARDRREVMAYPPPQVRVRSMGADGIEMELRCWISHAQERAWVTDRLLRGIKDSFDANGVQFPFPQRTLTYAKDLPAPARTPAQLQGPEAPPGRVLVVTRNRSSAVQLAAPMVQFAARVGASLVILHVRPIHEELAPAGGQAVLNEYLYAAQEMGVQATGRLELGHVAAVVPRVAKEEGANLILLGHGTERPWAFWKRNEVQAVKRNCTVPLLAMDTAQLLRPEVIDHWRGKLGASEPPPSGTPSRPK